MSDSFRFALADAAAGALFVGENVGMEFVMLLMSAMTSLVVALTVAALSNRARLTAFGRLRRAEESDSAYPRSVAWRIDVTNVGPSPARDVIVVGHQCVVAVPIDGTSFWTDRIAEITPGQTRPLAVFTGGRSRFHEDAALWIGFRQAWLPWRSWKRIRLSAVDAEPFGHPSVLDPGPITKWWRRAEHGYVSRMRRGNHSDSPDS